MVNQLLTMSIKVNIAPSAESNWCKRGIGNEEDKSWPRLLELAHGFRLVVAAEATANNPSVVRSSDFKFKELRALAERRALLF